MAYKDREVGLERKREDNRKRRSTSEYREFECQAQRERYRIQRQDSEHVESMRLKGRKRYSEHKDDLQFRLAHILRSRLGAAIKNKQKAGSAVSDLGCSIEQLKLWFMYQFQSGMTWDNYGEWEIDHVIPLSSFDLTDRQQFLEACNWYNLQPLWKTDNRSKGYN